MKVYVVIIHHEQDIFAFGTLKKAKEFVESDEDYRDMDYSIEELEIDKET